MTEDDMRRVLREYGLSFDPHKTKRGVYLYGIAERRESRYQVYLGKLAALSQMSVEMFERVVSMKSRALEGRITKCAKTECMKRSYEGNKLQLETAQGTFTVYLCDQHYEECTQQEKENHHHENSQSDSPDVSRAGARTNACNV